MTYQITVSQRGQLIKEYDGIESIDAEQAIDRIITEYYSDYAIEYNGALIVIGYEFTARRLGMVLS
jgi:hypothetical protein